MKCHLHSIGLSLVLRSFQSVELHYISSQDTSKFKKREKKKRGESYETGRTQKKPEKNKEKARKRKLLANCSFGKAVWRAFRSTVCGFGVWCGLVVSYLLWTINEPPQRGTGVVDLS